MRSESQTFQYVHLDHCRKKTELTTDELLMCLQVTIIIIHRINALELHLVVAVIVVAVVVVVVSVVVPFVLPTHNHIFPSRNSHTAVYTLPRDI